MSDEKERCPACGSDNVTKGRILGGISSIYFRPSGLRFWTLSAAVPMIGANKTSDEFFPAGRSRLRVVRTVVEPCESDAARARAARGRNRGDAQALRRRRRGRVAAEEHGARVAP